MNHVARLGAVRNCAFIQQGFGGLTHRVLRKALPGTAPCGQYVEVG
ncbi:MAG: hypothetical protein HZB18_16990 [Chloroflexi bacterium]|nr:hypothetical protein [Chloroflexota bacterium]